MTASFHGTVTILLVVAVVLLTFVTANVLYRLLRLETRIVSSGRDIFSALIGRTVPQDWVVNGSQATRILLLSEDCPACRMVASEAYAATKNGHRTTLAWRGDGVDLRNGAGPNGVHVVRGAHGAFEELGVRVTPVELWVNENVEVVAARPAIASKRSPLRAPQPMGS